MQDPGPKSGTISQTTRSAGLADYVLDKPIAGQLRFEQIYEDGAVLKYMVWDTAQMSVEKGRFIAPDTVTRDEYIISSCGMPVSWPDTGQRIIWPIYAGLPLCDTEPTDGQVLVWNEAEKNWCPGDLSDIVGVPDNIDNDNDEDAADMQNVDSGTTYGVTLTKFDTQVIWNSTDPGDKTTTIPATSAANDGFSLDIKFAAGDGSNHCIELPSGTIGGVEGGIQVQDNNCNLALRSNHAKTDWVIRQFSCFTPEACPPGEVPTPPPGSQFNEIEQGAALGPFAIDCKAYFGGLTTVRESVVIVNVVMQQNSQISPPNPQTPSVSAVTSPHLIFQQRMDGQTMSPDFCGLNPGPCEATMETWWAPAPTPLDHEVITVTFDGGVVAAIGNVMAFYYVSDINDPWDHNASLPAVASNPTSTFIPALVTGVSTTGDHSLLLIFGMGTAPADDVRFGNVVTPPTYLAQAISQPFIGVDTSATFGIIAPEDPDGGRNTNWTPTVGPLSNVTVPGPWVRPLFNSAGDALQWMVAVDALRYPFAVPSDSFI